MHNLKELKIWNEAIDLTVHVYKATKSFPSEEKYGLTSQVRKSAISIPSNIAEGAGRNSNKEFSYFLGVSNGSSYELQTQLIVAKKLNLLEKDKAENLLQRIDELQKMNYGLRIHFQNEYNPVSILNTQISIL